MAENRPNGNYVSRKGEHPSTVAAAITDPKLGFQQKAVVLVRAEGGMTSVSRHYLAGIRNHETVRELQRNEYITPKAGAEETAISSYDIMELTRAPKWESQMGDPFVRVGTWEFKLSSPEDVTGPIETLLRNVSAELSNGRFNRWANPHNGGVATLPVFVVEVPGFGNEVVDRVRELLASAEGTDQFVEVVDTRSFDREHLIELFEKFFPNPSRNPLERSSTVNAILDKYHGSAELALRIVSDAKRRPTDEQGKCIVPLKELFKEAAPQFAHLLEGGKSISRGD